MLADAMAPALPQQEKLTKKKLTADHPTWCPGCGDYSVLSSFYKVLERNNLPHENIVAIAGIGCSSRFPYFVNAHGVHFVHGRAVPFATGVSLSRSDIHVFVFGGDGDGYSIGGNHLDHCARKNVNMLYVIMDNQVYGLTKKQTSPTSPVGYKSKTDPAGAIDRPVNPMKKLIANGATFVARTCASNPAHMIDMMERGMKHNGFAVVEVLSECVQFYSNAFDAANPRRGGVFKLIEEKTHDGTSEDENRHDVTDEQAAYKLADQPFPGVFGVFFKVDRPTKNQLEQKWIDSLRAKNDPSDLDILRKTFDRLK